MCTHKFCVYVTYVQTIYLVDDEGITDLPTNGQTNVFIFGIVVAYVTVLNLIFFLQINRSCAHHDDQNQNNKSINSIDWFDLLQINDLYGLAARIGSTSLKQGIIRLKY